MPDAVDTVECAPDDGWRYHPKNVEQITDVNKLCNVASCWTFIGILKFMFRVWNPAIFLKKFFAEQIVFSTLVSQY